MWELTVARILREVLAAGAKRDWDKMIELAKELEELAIDERMESLTRMKDNSRSCREASFSQACTRQTCAAPGPRC